MKKLLLTSLVLLVVAAAALAQDVKSEASATPQPGNGNLLQQLGLTPEQVSQIRQLNKQRKPAMEEAQLRAREANRALDAAIYADNVDDAQVAARLDELQKAQSDVLRIRSTNELAIRRILTPEQLGRFREMRRQVAGAAEDRRKERIQNRGVNPNRPLQRQNIPGAKSLSPSPTPLVRQKP